MLHDDVAPAVYGLCFIMALRLVPDEEDLAALAAYVWTLSR